MAALPQDFLSAAAGLGLAQCLDCGTPVRPFVVGKTWTATHSPCCVTSDVLVVGLTIESNVTVKISGNDVFAVAGLLPVKGASNAPVRFTPPAPVNGWTGIRLGQAAPDSLFIHAILQRSKLSGLRSTKNRRNAVTESPKTPCVRSFNCRSLRAVKADSISR